MFKKIGEFLKEFWEWIVAILAILSGYFLWKKFMGPTQLEKDILNNIKENDKKIAELTKEAQALIEKENDLKEKLSVVNGEIDKKYSEYEARITESKNKKEEIKKESKDTQANINFINKKYGSDG
ncbi:MAG: hypothetical protein PHT94_01080 [Candidatus Nanoarchaeia archaeon]|nr:hypothetical protein [Candidatus Nanoarchaeia archaeon]